MPVIQLGPEAGARFAGLALVGRGLATTRFLGLGAGFKLCLIALVPARTAVRVMVVMRRCIDRLKGFFVERLAMSLDMKGECGK